MRSISRCVALLTVLALAATAAWAQQRRVYPSGTAFEESFGNVATNGDPCWSGGPSSCDQSWAVTAGSGQQIVSAPSGWGGDALDLPAGATALELKSYGTLPTIPADSGFTLTVTVEMSAYDSGYPNLVVLDNVAGQLEASFGDHSTGFFEGLGNPCPAAAATVHTLEVVMNGAASKFLIDGVQCGADFSDPGYAPTQLVLYGSSANDVKFQEITIDGASVTGGWQPSSFADFAAQSGATTVAAMNAGTHCFPGAGGWVADTFTGTSAFSTDTGNFAAPLSVCGTDYSGNSGVSLELTWPTGSESEYAWEFDGNTTSTGLSGVVASMGFKWKTDAPDTASFTDQAGIFASGGTFNFFHVCGGTATTPCTGTSPTQLWICAEQTNGTSPNCYGPIAPGTWYWITMERTSSGNDLMNVYSWPSLSELASLGLTDTPPTSADTAMEFKFGPAAETPGVPMDSWFSDIVFEYADAQFPVLPPTAVASCPHTLMILGAGCG